MKKINFDQVIERMSFSKKAEVPNLDRAGRLTRNRDTKEIRYENNNIRKMVPNMNFFYRNKLTLDSLPHEYTNAFLPFKKSKEQKQNDGRFTIGEWCTHTNLKATLSNAGEGGTIYTDLKLLQWRR